MFIQDKKNIKTSHLNSTLFPSRVKNILLNNNSNLFDKKDGWAGIGTIQFNPVFKANDSGNNLYFAKPLFSNIKQYPLKNEIILILSLPSPTLNENENSSEYYYLNIPMSFWNGPNHNIYPDNNGEDLNFGDTFQENQNISSLLPEEGDVIFEGRFGNSIRFSSTTPNKKNNNNSWSSNPNDESGKPILIIRNGQKITNQHPWVPVQEDINEDGSSIWLSSGQEIPLNYSCNNLKTFNKTLSDSFDITLQIPDNKI